MQDSLKSKNTAIHHQYTPRISPETEEVWQEKSQDNGDRFGGGFGKCISSTSLAIGRTSPHILPFTVKLDLAGGNVEVVVDTGASALVAGKRLAYKLGIWNKVRKVKVRQKDESLF